MVCFLCKKMSAKNWVIPVTTVTQHEHPWLSNPPCSTTTPAMKAHHAHACCQRPAVLKHTPLACIEIAAPCASIWQRADNSDWNPCHSTTTPAMKAHHAQDSCQEPAIHQLVSPSLTIKQKRVAQFIKILAPVCRAHARPSIHLRVPWAIAV